MAKIKEPKSVAYKLHLQALPRGQRAGEMHSADDYHATGVPRQGDTEP